MIYRVDIYKLLYQEVYLLQGVKGGEVLILCIIRKRKSYIPMRSIMRTESYTNKDIIIGICLLMRIIRMEDMLINISYMII